MSDIFKATAITLAILGPIIIKVVDSHEIKSLKATIEAQEYGSFENEKAVQMWRQKYDSAVSNYDSLKKWVEEGHVLAVDSVGRVIMVRWDAHFNTKEVNFNKPVNTVNIGN